MAVGKPLTCCIKGLTQHKDPCVELALVSHHFFPPPPISLAMKFVLTPL